MRKFLLFEIRSINLGDDMSEFDWFVEIAFIVIFIAFIIYMIKIREL